MTRLRKTKILAVFVVCTIFPALQGEETPPAPQIKESGENVKSGGLFKEAWRYVSETSAVIYWQTAKPALSYVEYGETDKYGKKTKLSAKSEISGKPYFTHFHRLAGLETGKACHYRMVIVDPETEEEARSKDAVITPKKLESAIRIPGELQGPPYTLKKPGHYILTKDITVVDGAIIIGNHNITLDLDGHTIVYDQTDDAPSKAPPARGWPGVAVRVATWQAKNCRILNGTIRQGNGGHGYGTYFSGHGYNPIAGGGMNGFEIAGVTAVHNYKDVLQTLLLHNTCVDVHIHHNITEDLAKEKETKAGKGVDAIRIESGKSRSKYAHHNLIKRTRQYGIVGADKTHHNEIYVADPAMAWGRRCGIRMWSKSEWKAENVHDNKVFGAPEGAPEKGK